jgi:hypothetical protein
MAVQNIIGTSVVGLTGRLAKSMAVEATWRRAEPIESRELKSFALFGQKPNKRSHG